ncbi:MAG: TonB-dependent receptor, partial [Tannerellaceae bacterium]|nr:TonB-dependent receptor [Tannerellaceae bacterium]
TAAKITIKAESSSFYDILLAIEKQTDYLFVYDKSEIDLSKKITINAHEKSITEVLTVILGNTDIEYAIEGSNIMLMKKNSTRNLNIIRQQSGKTLTGTVTDVTGEPIIGANVVVEGTTNGSITDIDGKFSLQNVPDNAVIKVSYIGYLEQIINTQGKNAFTVALQEDSKALSEIVVVGYGAQKKENLVGAVTAIQGREIESANAFDVTNAISGRLPGTTVIQGSGEPGKDEGAILIRGRTTLGDRDKTTTPLIVVDGIPDRSLYEVDPSDIESISVLKDASAAIYGSRAANGVILVTTKSGANKKASLNYQFSQGFKTPTVLPKLANAGEYSQYISDYQTYEGLSRLYSDRDIELYKSGADPWEHPNSDWMGDLVKTWTTDSRHNLSLTGGGYENMRYYASFGYKNNQSFYQQESANYEQYNLRVKLDIPIASWLETSIQYGGYFTTRKYPTTGTDQLVGWATLVIPTVPSFWPTGEPGPDFEGGVNPVVNTSFDAGYDLEENYKNELTFRASFKPPMIKGLSIDGFFNYDVNNKNQKRFKKPWTLYYANYETAVRNSDGFITSMELEPRLRGLDSPELTELNERYRRKMFNLSFTYARTFGDHTFSIFGAFEQFDEDSFGFDAYRKFFISDLVQALDAGGEKDKTNSGWMSIYARQSYISRLNYSYKSKYLAELIFRRDGSFKFPPSNRWGNFPAILLAWRASEENFWKENLSFIDYFKLRATYGRMGMDPGDPFQYINKYSLDAGVTLGTVKDVVTKIYQSVLANPNITWEKQTTYNLGFDSQFYNQMFHLNTEFFYSKRSDILVTKNASVPSFTGLALPDENIAVVDNKGFEIDAGYHKTFEDKIKFDLSGNISWARNKVVFMDEPERAVSWQRETGHPYGTKLVYNAIGIFKTKEEVDAYPHWTGAKPGDVIFEDVNGDGEINADDRILLDKTDAPELFYGIKLDLAYKNWSLSLLAQGQGSYYKSVISGNRGVGQNVFKWMATDYWTPENSNSDQARPFHRADQYWSYLSNANTYWYDNMAYLRLKNVVLNYTIPQAISKKIGISRADVFASGYNLFLLYSAQKNYDPEIGNPQAYPAMRTFSFGLKLNF